LLKLTVEQALNVELEEHLGYPKHAPKGRGSGRSFFSCEADTLQRFAKGAVAHRLTPLLRPLHDHLLLGEMTVVFRKPPKYL
jgi:hypothetical protein